jgi:hypothetical protein
MLEVGLMSPGFLMHKVQETLFAGKPVEKKEQYCYFEVFI